MANIGVYAQKAMLDWVLGGATPTQPAVRAVGLSLGTPSSVSGSDVSAGSGYSRQAAQFGAAASPAGSASNTNAMTFGPFSSAASVVGAQLWDNTAIGSGNMLWYGTLTSGRSVAIGDTLVLPPGELTISLA
jgi:hypothetical protein